MRLKTILTYGWPHSPEDLNIVTPVYHASQLFSEASAGGFETTFERNLVDEDCGIFGLDKLFRRRVDGYKDFKKMIGELMNFNTEGRPHIICYMDVFAYVFLKGVKNIDFLLPEIAPEPTMPYAFRNIEKSWWETGEQLNAFESMGVYARQSETYLALRNIISRTAARDELRTLATLLVSGPSNLKDISGDLGLNYSLSQRTLAAFSNLDILEEQEDAGGKKTGVYQIATEHLGMVVFALRSVMGVDFLTPLHKKVTA